MFREQERYGNDPCIVTRTSKAVWNQPFSTGKNRWEAGDRVFVCSWSDFFHEDADKWRKDAWDVIRKRQDLTWLILTKRPEQIKKALPSDWDKLKECCWLGITAENQRMLDERAEYLLDIDAPVKFLSIEPMLSCMNVTPYIGYNAYRCNCGWHETERNIFFSGKDRLCLNCGKYAKTFRAFNWVIVGAESGGDRRACQSEWVLDIVKQCKDASVPCFVKQLHFGKKLRLSKDMNEWPEKFRVQEYPNEET